MLHGAYRLGRLTVPQPRLIRLNSHAVPASCDFYVGARCLSPYRAPVAYGLVRHLSGITGIGVYQFILPNTEDYHHV